MTDILAIARQWAQPSSAEDAVSVNNLIQAYALFTDQGQRDDLASLFTHDATWDGSELGYDTATGPDCSAGTSTSPRVWRTSSHRSSTAASCCGARSASATCRRCTRGCSGSGSSTERVRAQDVARKVSER
jgi:hypothetical protein